MMRVIHAYIECPFASPHPSPTSAHRQKTKSGRYTNAVVDCLAGSFVGRWRRQDDRKDRATANRPIQQQRRIGRRRDDNTNAASNGDRCWSSEGQMSNKTVHTTERDCCNGRQSGKRERFIHSACYLKSEVLDLEVGAAALTGEIIYVYAGCSLI